MEEHTGFFASLTGVTRTLFLCLNGEPQPRVAHIPTYRSDRATLEMSKINGVRREMEVEWR
ncbi:hypothetical protein M378DRAFT_170051 [Amanita muscaria Koide BX008]|uniref:Uncharacterized protein n=1 Tax=Amanita muscaria (strain Koide BX008) TaxID=946122 RepID=A0A0C2S7W4_AMAMK|nr:hypothetical protein M378DRAFT_170051 [Amanita muscaria Koide BX008]